MTPKVADFLLGVMITCILGIIVVGLAWAVDSWRKR